MSINWDNVESEYSNNEYKDYAPEGKHKVKCIDAETKQVGQNGNYIIKFIFEEDDYKYPTADHWITKNKDNWRYHHMKSLFEVLGAPEDKAKQVIEKAEEKGDFEFAVKAYEASFKRLLAKKPEVEINVYFSGRTSAKGNPINDAEFTDSRVRMKNKDDKPLAGAEEIVLDEELPF